MLSEITFFEKKVIEAAPAAQRRLGAEGEAEFVKIIKKKPKSITQRAQYSRKLLIEKT